MATRTTDGMGRMGPTEASRVEFDPPAKLKLDGESGEALVRWKKKADGKICIVSMEGVSLGGDEGPEEVEDDEGEEEYA